MPAYKRNHDPQKYPLTWLAWFCLSNILLFWLLGNHYLWQVTPLTFNVINTINAVVVWIFLILAYLSQLALLASIPYCLLWGIYRLYPRRYWLMPSAVILASCSMLLLLIDGIVYHQYGFHLNGIIWHLLLGGAAAEIFNFSKLEWLSFTAIVLSIFILESLLAWLVWRYLVTLHCFRCMVYFASSVFIALFISYEMFLLSNTQPISLLAQQAQALPLYDDLLAKLLPINDSMVKVEIVGAGNFEQRPQAFSTLQYPKHPLQCQAPATPLNLLIIVIDTWRFDMLNTAVTPHLKQFAATTWQFTQHWSGGNSTQPGIFSLFYGLPGTYWTAMLEQHRSPLLLDKLQAQHYRFGIFASAPLINPAFNKTVFVHVPNLALNSPGNTVVARDQAITKNFLQFLQTNNSSKQPFFGFLFYDAAHSYCSDGVPIQPFQPAVTDCNRLILTDQTDPIPYRNRYQNALYFIDQEINQVLQQLQQQGLLKNTVVLITGDHGEEFNDTRQGYWGHASDFNHYQTQTPLLIYWPGKKPQIFPQQTSHYDITPTLMQQLLGCQNPSSDYSIGQSLFSKAVLPYLIIVSYIDFAIVQPDQIIRILPSGNFIIKNSTGQTLAHTQLPLNLVKEALQQLRSFYRGNH